MRQLSPAGQQAIESIAQRHGFSVDATLHMFDAVFAGNGSMAQFGHPEFAGSGQWMRGGMTMVSDMFNNALKGRVDALCADLSDLLAREPGLLHGGSSQSQYQGVAPAGTAPWQPGSATMPAHSDVTTGSGSLFVQPPAGTSADWWGPTLRYPNSTGAQNGMRYAYFAQARRLAIEVDGHVTIYDTLDHQIGGVSQQQGSLAGAAFQSQYGTVDLSSLPVISIDGHAPSAPVEAAPAMPAPAAAFGGSTAPAMPAAPADAADIFATIEKLADLHARGILDPQEFAAKKAELMSRL